MGLQRPMDDVTVAISMFYTVYILYCLWGLRGQSCSGVYKWEVERCEWRRNAQFPSSLSLTVNCLSVIGIVVVRKSKMQGSTSEQCYPLPLILFLHGPVCLWDELLWGCPWLFMKCWASPSSGAGLRWSSEDEVLLKIMSPPDPEWISVQSLVTRIKFKWSTAKR